MIKIENIEMKNAQENRGNNYAEMTINTKIIL